VAWFVEGPAFDTVGCVELLISIMRDFSPFTGNASQAETTKQQQKG
jgi:hypothetical protein